MLVDRTRLPPVEMMEIQATDNREWFRLAPRCVLIDDMTYTFVPMTSFGLCSLSHDVMVSYKSFSRLCDPFVLLDLPLLVTLDDYSVLISWTCCPERAVSFVLDIFPHSLLPLFLLRTALSLIV